MLSSLLHYQDVIQRKRLFLYPTLMLKKIALFSLIFPCTLFASAFPEPMVFDLMRGLDAKKGELEINTLMASTFSGNDQHLLINPEIEYAMANGFAVEIEVPIDKKPLSTKFGAQYTLTKPSPQFMLGLQAIYEPFFELGREDFSLSTVINLRLREKLSVVSMIGLRDATINGRNDHYAFILNITFFYRYSDRLSFGLENDRNIYYGKEKLKALSIPQVSWRFHPLMKVQSGLGFNWHDNKNIEGYLRVIKEF